MHFLPNNAVHAYIQLYTLDSKWRCLGLAKTEFEVFAQKIATYFQGDLAPEEFTRTLFKKIYLNPNGGTLLHDMGLGRCVIIFTERTTLPLWRRK